MRKVYLQLTVNITVNADEDYEFSNFEDDIDIEIDNLSTNHDNGFDILDIEIVKVLTLDSK